MQVSRAFLLTIWVCPLFLFSDRIRLALKYKAQIYFLSDSRLTVRLPAEGSASIFGGPPISYFWAYRTIRDCTLAFPRLGFTVSLLRLASPPDLSISAGREGGPGSKSRDRICQLAGQLARPVDRRSCQTAN